MNNTNMSENGQQDAIEEQIIQNINAHVSQDLTMDGSYAVGYRSPCYGGRSPSQGRSVREYEEQMSTLRKENFNLKLRIYVLEEKLPGLDQFTTPEGQESLMKQYIDIKVDTEVLKNDLEEKKQLLREAAEAIDHLENIQRETDERNHHIIDELKHKIQYLEHENKQLEKSYKSSYLLADESKLTESAIRIQLQELEISAKDSEVKIKEMLVKYKKLEEIIIKKNKTIDELHLCIEDLKFENSDLKDLVKMKDNTLKTTDIKKIQNDLDKCRSELANKICELDEVQEKYSKQNEDYEKAVKYIEKLIKVTTVMQNEIDQIRKDNDKENENTNANESSVPVANYKKLQNKFDTISHQLVAATADIQNKSILIEKLKVEVHQGRKETEKAQKRGKECAELCNILTVRLEELATFLDSLLKHKDVLNLIAPDTKREIQNVINKSLDLSRSFTAESLSITNLSFNESNLAQLSNITGILDNTHVSKFFDSKTEIKSNNSKDKIIHDLKHKLESFKEKRTETSFTKIEYKKGIKPKCNTSLPLVPPDLSEFEVWSEPDRNVSLARIGLNKSKTYVNSKNLSSKTNKETDSNSITNESLEHNDEKNKSRTKLQDKITQYEKIVMEKDNKILEIQCQLVETDNRLKSRNIKLLEATQELEDNTDRIKRLEFELNTFKNQFDNLNEMKINDEKLKSQLNIKNDELNKLHEEKDHLLAKIEKSELLIKNLKIQIEELTEKYEVDIKNIKENEYIKLEQLNQEFKNDLSENIKDLQLKHQETLNKNWIEKIEHESILKQTEVLNLELENLKFEVENLKESEKNLKEQLVTNQKTIHTLQKNLDENLLLISKTTLERTKIVNEKLNLEKYVQELLQNSESLRNENNLLVDQLNLLMDKQNECHKSEENIVEKCDDNERLQITSPDLGIESDTGRTTNEDVIKTNKFEIKNEKREEKVLDQRNSSTAKTETSNPVNLPVQHKCEEINKENLKLRTKYKRLTRMYKELLKVIKKTNENMEQFEKNVIAQIRKTNEVLEYARNNISNNIKLSDIKK